MMRIIQTMTLALTNQLQAPAMLELRHPKVKKTKKNPVVLKTTVKASTTKDVKAMQEEESHRGGKPPKSESSDESDDEVLAV